MRPMQAIRMAVGCTVMATIPSVVLFGLNPDFGALLFVVSGLLAGALCLMSD